MGYYPMTNKHDIFYSENRSLFPYASYFFAFQDTRIYVAPACMHRFLR